MYSFHATSIYKSKIVHVSWFFTHVISQIEVCIAMTMPMDPNQDPSRYDIILIRLLNNQHIFPLLLCTVH